MEEFIKQIIDGLENLDPSVAKKLEHILLQNEAEEVEYQTVQDSFGSIHTATCPSCGETLQFERNSQLVLTYSYCYRCGKKLKKKQENE